MQYLQDIQRIRKNLDAARVTWDQAEIGGAQSDSDFLDEIHTAFAELIRILEKQAIEQVEEVSA